MAIQIQLRNGSTAEWTNENPTLAEGEVGIDTDQNMFKVGDGVTTWNNLDFVSEDQDLSDYAEKSNVLELDNTDAFTPDADHEPATKKYVDDNAGGGGGGIISDHTVYFNPDQAEVVGQSYQTYEDAVTYCKGQGAGPLSEAGTPWNIILPGGDVGTITKYPGINLIAAKETIITRLESDCDPGGPTETFNAVVKDVYITTLAIPAGKFLYLDNCIIEDVEAPTGSPAGTAYMWPNNCNFYGGDFENHLTFPGQGGSPDMFLHVNCNFLPMKGNIENLSGLFFGGMIMAVGASINCNGYMSMNNMYVNVTSITGPMFDITNCTVENIGNITGPLTGNISQSHISDITTNGDGCTINLNGCTVADGYDLGNIDVGDTLNIETDFKDGWNGDFNNADGDTVTVVDGIITDVS